MPDPSSACQTFLFTFRPNGKSPNDQPLVEALAEQLAGYDPSVAPGARQYVWNGTTEQIGDMLLALGFVPFNVQGVLGAVGDHRNADRRLDVTPEQLTSAGFQPAP